MGKREKQRLGVGVVLVLLILGGFLDNTVKIWQNATGII